MAPLRCLREFAQTSADLVSVGARLDVSAVPPRRLVGLATYGLSTKAAERRRLAPREHRVAVLVAAVKVLSGRATDDVLELFDLLMVTDLFSKAERESKDEKLRRYPRVSRYSGKLAAGGTRRSRREFKSVVQHCISVRMRVASEDVPAGEGPMTVRVAARFDSHHVGAARPVP